MNIPRRRMSRPSETNYDAARARAIDWLGDRYLLATPIKPRQETGEAAHFSGGASAMSTQRAI